MNRTSLAPLLLLSGCIHLHTVRVGQPRPPTQPAAIRYERLAYQDAIASYDQVAAVCANVEPDSLFRDDWTGRYARKKVGQEASRVGGEVVTTIGTCSNGRNPGVELGVFRGRGAVSGTASLAR